MRACVFKILYSLLQIQLITSLPTDCGEVSSTTSSATADSTVIINGDNDCSTDDCCFECNEATSTFSSVETTVIINGDDDSSTETECDMTSVETTDGSVIIQSIDDSTVTEACHHETVYIPSVTTIDGGISVQSIVESTVTVVDTTVVTTDIAVTQTVVVTTDVTSVSTITESTITITNTFTTEITSTITPTVQSTLTATNTIVVTDVTTVTNTEPTGYEVVTTATACQPTVINESIQDCPVCSNTDFCTVNGLQNIILNGVPQLTETCGITVQGEIPDINNMVSTIIISPQNGDNITLGSDINVVIKSINIEYGYFDDPETEYLLSPQRVNTDGKIKGHSHIAIQQLDNLETVPEPKNYVFFRGLNGQGDILSTLVLGDVFLHTGSYRLCTLTTSQSHAPVLLPTVKRGFSDDCIRFNIV